MSLKKVISHLKEKNNFLVTAHINLEGDALGSEIALFRLLKAFGKRATMLNDDSIPCSYAFLSDTRLIRRFQRKNIPDFDCLVAVDCSDLRRAGGIAEMDLSGKTVVNIDHHVSNDNFGDVRWIDHHASSTSEMIYKLYKLMKVPFNRKIATALYVGMLTDTGSFRYTNTGSSTHRAVADLMKHGLDIRQIYNQIYENIPFSDMKLLADILPAMKRSASGKVVWFELPRKIWSGRKIFFDLTEHILSFGRSISDVEVVCLFKENLGENNEVRVNFRSHGKVDVNRIASSFGGGGHKTASGATVTGKLQEVRKKVLAKVREALEK